MFPNLLGVLKTFIRFTTLVFFKIVAHITDKMKRFVKFSLHNNRMGEFTSLWRGRFSFVLPNISTQRQAENQLGTLEIHSNKETFSPSLKTNKTLQHPLWNYCSISIAAGPVLLLYVLVATETFASGWQGYNVTSLNCYFSRCPCDLREHLEVNDCCVAHEGGQTDVSDHQQSQSREEGCRLFSGASELSLLPGRENSGSTGI